MTGKGKVFIKDETKIASSVGGAEWAVVYFGQLLTEFYEQEFCLGGIES